MSLRTRIIDEVLAAAAPCTKVKDFYGRFEVGQPLEAAGDA